MFTKSYLFLLPQAHPAKRGNGVWGRECHRPTDTEIWIEWRRELKKFIQQNLWSKPGFTHVFVLLFLFSGKAPTPDGKRKHSMKHARTIRPSQHYHLVQHLLSKDKQFTFYKIKRKTPGRRVGRIFTWNRRRSLWDKLNVTPTPPPPKKNVICLSVA